MKLFPYICIRNLQARPRLLSAIRESHSGSLFSCTQPQVLPPNNQTDRPVEHNLESISFAHSTAVPTKTRLVYVLLQVFVRNIVVATSNHSTEARPKTFNQVGERISIDKLLFAMVHYRMAITLCINSFIFIYTRKIKR